MAQRKQGAPRRRRAGRLSMCLIARNEAHNVRACFESFWEHVDEVVLVDTGSRDGTIGEARRFARERGEPGKLIVGRFKWVDDFAAARNAAEDLATGDVRTWCDLDTRVVGACAFPTIVQAFADEPDLGMMCAKYAGDARFGDLRSSVWYAYFVRAPCVWVNPTWETQRRASDVRIEKTDACAVVHTRREWHGRRDLDIALAWQRREPDRIDVAAIIGYEALEHGRTLGDRHELERALASWRRVLSLAAHCDPARGIAEERGGTWITAGAMREAARLEVAECLLALDRPAEALSAARAVYDELPAHRVEARIISVGAYFALGETWRALVALCELRMLAPKHARVCRFFENPRIANHPMIAAAKAAASVEHER